ncbi:MAG: efflux RND transporter periplasmic adaptor subunit [Planctomycetota bacterium]
MFGTPRLRSRLLAKPLSLVAKCSRECVLGLFATALAASGFVHSAAAQMPPAVVKTAEVQQREVSVGQTFVGTVMPIRGSTIGSSVEARVVGLDVDEGMEVEKGQVLAELRSEPLKIELAAAEADLELRQQELAALRESLPQDIEQAEARMLAAKAIQDFTLARLRRSQSLLASRAVSEEDVQDAVSAAEGATQRYRESVSAFNSLTSTQEERLAQAEARVTAQQEAVNKLKDDIAEHTIAAPFAGYITRKHTELGQWVAKGSPVVDMVQVDEVDVEVSVLESVISRVQPRQTIARVQISSLPEEWIEAPVYQVVPQGDVRSRTFPVIVRVKNRPGPAGVLFQPGMFARVTLPVGQKGNALLVPKDAVVLGGETPVVYAVAPMPASTPGAGGPPGGAPAGKASTRGGPPGAPPAPKPDGMARLVPVELGAAVGNDIEVRGPLEPREKVVIEGNERLFPGRPLVIAKGDATAAAQSSTSESGKAETGPKHPQ